MNEFIINIIFVVVVFIIIHFRSSCSLGIILRLWHISSDSEFMFIAQCEQVNTDNEKHFEMFYISLIIPISSPQYMREDHLALVVSVAAGVAPGGNKPMLMGLIWHKCNISSWLEEETLKRVISLCQTWFLHICCLVFHFSFKHNAWNPKGHAPLQWYVRLYVSLT